MGDVYEAEHVEHRRRVAIKLLNQRLTQPQDRARFLREGQLAASIADPHVCYIFGSEEILGVPAIVMELLPGGTLKDRVQKDGPLRPAHAVDVILQVIAGLDAAQRAGILHRDEARRNKALPIWAIAVLGILAPVPFVGVVLAASARSYLSGFLVFLLIQLRRRLRASSPSSSRAVAWCAVHHLA